MLRFMGSQRVGHDRATELKKFFKKTIREYYAQFYANKFDNLKWTNSLEDMNKISFMNKSVQFSCSVVSNSLRPHESQHARPPCPS